MVCVPVEQRLPLPESSRHKPLVVGERFGRLRIASLPFMRPDCRGVHYECECDCGELTCARVDTLRDGTTASCGCLQAENGAIVGKVTGPLNRKHGRSRHPLYEVWRNMNSRCHNPDGVAFERYGGRGIKVCEEWRESIEAFAEWALSHGWQHGLQLDRRDNDGDYEPANCRFVTPRTNSQNRCSNVQVEIDGETHCLTEWSRRLGINISTVVERRRRGLSDVEALTAPLRSQRIRREVCHS